MSTEKQHKLPARLQKAYDFCVQRWLQRIPLPTVRELAAHLGVSQSGAHYMIQDLVAAGFLARGRSRHHLILRRTPPLCPHCHGSGTTVTTEKEA